MRPARRQRLYRLLAGFALVANAVAAHAHPKVDPALRVALQQAVGMAESFDNRFAAQVWLLDMSNRLEPYIPDPEQRMHLLRVVHREALRADLRPNLVLAVIQVESAFRQYAISSAGARGLMQIMPFWKKEIGRSKDNLLNIRTNLRYGCTILRYYLKISGGNLSEALARYNGSYGEYWYPRRVYAALSDRWYVR